MDVKTFMGVATLFTKLRMYPYFDISSYILMCIMVRDDHLSPHSGMTMFSRRHPLACWVSSMMLCFGSSLLANFLMGEPVITPMKNHRDIITATIVWYFINYSPFDVVYKLIKLTPLKLVVSCMKEVQRVHKIHHGVLTAAKIYPGAYLVIVIIGVVKGVGYYFIRLVERLIRGVWTPSANEFLSPSFVTKASICASVLFILEQKGFVEAPHAAVYFGVVIFFVYFKLSSLLIGLHDPFFPFENLFCAIFMGGVWDALHRAISKESSNAPPLDKKENPKSAIDKKKE